MTHTFGSNLPLVFLSRRCATAQTLGFGLAALTVGATAAGAGEVNKTKSNVKHNLAELDLSEEEKLVLEALTDEEIVLMEPLALEDQRRVLSMDAAERRAFLGR